MSEESIVVALWVDKDIKSKVGCASWDVLVAVEDK